MSPKGVHPPSVRYPDGLSRNPTPRTTLLAEPGPACASGLAGLVVADSSRARGITSSVAGSSLSHSLSHCPMHLLDELKAQLAEVMFGLQGAGEPAAVGEAAQVSLVTLEGAEVLVQLDLGGCRVMPGSEREGLVCDCLNSLLLNASPGFVARFNASLFAALQTAGVERRADNDEEWEDGASEDAENGAA